MKNRDKRNNRRKKPHYKPHYNVSSTIAKVLVISPFVKCMMLHFTEETKPTKDQVTYWVPDSKWPNSQVHAQNHYSKFTLLVISCKCNSNRQTHGRWRPASLSEELDAQWKISGSHTVQLLFWELALTLANGCYVLPYEHTQDFSILDYPSKVCHPRLVVMVDIHSQMCDSWNWIWQG